MVEPQPYSSPQALVEALHARQPAARQQLQQLLSEPLERLVGQVIEQHGLSDDRDLLVLHAQHLAETMLRFRPSAGFAGLSWQAFRATLTLQLARVAMRPFGGAQPDGAFGPSPLPASPGYDSETFFRP